MKNQVSKLTESFRVIKENGNLRTMVGITKDPEKAFFTTSKMLFIRQSDGMPFKFVNGVFSCIHKG